MSPALKYSPLSSKHLLHWSWRGPGLVNSLRESRPINAVARKYWEAHLAEGDDSFGLHLSGAGEVKQEGRLAG